MNHQFVTLGIPRGPQPMAVGIARPKRVDDFDSEQPDHALGKRIIARVDYPTDGTIKCGFYTSLRVADVH